MNCYIALLFKERFDLHVTLKYYKDLDGLSIVQLVDSVNGVMVRNDIGPESRQFPLCFDREARFGAHNNIRVLLLSKDSFDGKNLTASVTIFPPYVHLLMDKYCVPHVTCMDKSLNLTVDAVAILHRQTVIARWELKCLE